MRAPFAGGSALEAPTWRKYSCGLSLSVWISSPRTAGRSLPPSADELRGQIARFVELVAPLDGPTGRGDDPVRAFNLHVRAWIEETARLMVGHLDM